MTEDAVREYLARYDGPELRLMEVCGSHTAAIAKNGISDMLSPRIRLISGPGCPVCVTPTAYIDRLISLAETPGCAVVTFGDLLRVPGGRGTLQEASGRGGDVRMVYSPFDALVMAEKEPSVTFIMAAVGFETTTPLYALMMEDILEKKLTNLKLLTALKTMPAVIGHLLENGAAVDGFLAPGHVAVVTGSGIFRPLAEKWQMPFAVAGFDGMSLLRAIYVLVRARGRGEVFNLYPQVVTEEGSTVAQALTARYFEPGPALWRGLGVVPASGRLLKAELAAYDAGSDGLNDDSGTNAACCCGSVLAGRMSPPDCPLFGRVCTPLTPQGACMVSAEGSCHTYYSYHRR